MEDKVVGPRSSPAWEQGGYQPKPVLEASRPQVSGGYQPTTGQSPPPTPPNQGSSGKK